MSTPVMDIYITVKYIFNCKIKYDRYDVNFLNRVLCLLSKYKYIKQFMQTMCFENLVQFSHVFFSYLEKTDIWMQLFICLLLPPRISIEHWII